MLNRSAALSLLALGSVAVAHAAPINGAFSALGTDAYTANTITFSTGQTPQNQVTGLVQGTFASYLADGSLISFFPAFPAGTPLPYQNGMNTVPSYLFPAGQTGVELFTTSGNGETFNFYLATYSAQIVSGVPGCENVVGPQPNCLDVTGNGYFNGIGSTAFTATPGNFSFTSQYQVGQAFATMTSFSASVSSNGPTSVTPEPSSLVLLGTGLIGLAGAARRKFRA